MEIIVTSLLAFISTNIDDIFILTLFFGSKKFKESEIIAGQLLGICALIAISIIGSLIGLFIDQEFIGLLGLVPIYLGIQGLVELSKEVTQGEMGCDNVGRKNKTLAIAGVTIANGGDNIGIYVPLFATLTFGDKIAMVLVFLTMTFVWCLMAKYFTKRPYVAKAVDKYGHIITPFVLILLGVYILFESEALGLLSRF
jgi:cadmium resistance protein CadD (predicted permease)